MEEEKCMSESRLLSELSKTTIKEKIEAETLQKQLNPSRNKNIILGRSNSLMNVRIKIKNDEKLYDRLLHKTRDLKSSLSNLKKIAENEEQKNIFLTKNIYALNDELSSKWSENEVLKTKLYKKSLDKKKAERKSNDKVSYTNKIFERCQNMKKTLKMIKNTLGTIKFNIRDGDKIGDQIARNIECENFELKDKVGKIKEVYDVYQNKINNLYMTREKLKTDIHNEAIVYKEKFQMYKQNSEDLEKKINELKAHSYFLQINYDIGNADEKLKEVEKIKKGNLEIQKYLLIYKARSKVSKSRMLV